ncbi:hypothetical protein JB92DRAFT_3109320 [Gautieria morchelliformis]|nr:hypothetical protein JB92DRAFT_3109320 [Gautieria morchelliformis]
MATQQLLVESRNTAFLAVEYQLQTLGKSYALLLARIPSHASTISHAASLDNEGQLTATTSRNELYSKENDDATYYPSKTSNSPQNLFSINYCLANQEAKGRSTRGGVKEAFTKLSEAEKEFYSELSKTNKSRKISPIKHSLRITLPLDVVRVDAERRDRFRDARCRRMQSGGIGAGARGAGGCRAEGSVLGRGVQVEDRESVLGHAVQVDAEHGGIGCVHVPAVVHIRQYKKNRFYSAIYRGEHRYTSHSESAHLSAEQNIGYSSISRFVAVLICSAYFTDIYSYAQP